MSRTTAIFGLSLLVTLAAACEDNEGTPTTRTAPETPEVIIDTDTDTDCVDNDNDGYSVGHSEACYPLDCDDGDGDVTEECYDASPHQEQVEQYGNTDEEASRLQVMLPGCNAETGPSKVWWVSFDGESWISTENCWVESPSGGIVSVEITDQPPPDAE